MSTTMTASFSRLADPLSIFTNTKNESPFKTYLHPLNNLSQLTNSLFILNMRMLEGNTFQLFESKW